MRAAILALLLAGCATGTVHVPSPTNETGWARWTDKPVTVEVTWHRVGFFLLQDICKSRYSPLTYGQGGVGPAPSVFGTNAATVIVPVHGCAITTPDLKRCTIYTLEHTWEAVVGHEIAHCYGVNNDG